ncbi:phosphate ABC transporter substrate-binding protein [Dictyobacter alpinus]|uniref:Phosphate-binding protein n=1 Tax=Dictyobacter alpinus TaxID=2014873 RepID=A0A402B673_9CHLR|nr:phosphate ABC transporter substrate-binding protein [Dictyobacter alpinus]GCE26856.1 phosphate ABC transporter substrate-binding protein [Dictyobacter alpinus]
MLKKIWCVVTMLVVSMVMSIVICACGNTDASQSIAASSNGTTKSGSLTCFSGNLQVTGSTALQPLAKNVAAAYQQQCSGANITVGGGGSSTGLKNAQDGSSQIGNSDIFANKSRYPDLVDHQVAAVAFSVIINENVTNVRNLTSQQLKRIYSGQATNWKEFGGPDLPIVAVSRPAGSGTRVTFEEYVLGQREKITGNPIANASGEVATTVNQTAGAISYIASDYARKNNLNVVTLDNVDETAANIENNSYKFWNIEHMYTKGAASGLAKAYIDYTKSPDTAPLRRKQGFLDISKISQAALKAKTPKNI